RRRWGAPTTHHPKIINARNLTRRVTLNIKHATRPKLTGVKPNQISPVSRRRASKRRLHLICSPPVCIGGGGRGADQYGDTRRVGGCVGLSLPVEQSEGARPYP